MLAGMRIAALVLLALAGLAGAARGQTSPAPRPAPPSAARPAPGATPPAAPIRPVGTMRELMAHVIRPTSDAVFYITSRTPASGEDWAVLQGQTLALAESANLLLTGSRAIDQPEWKRFAEALRGTAGLAQQAARRRSAAEVLEAGNQIYETCEGCHQRYLAPRVQQ